MNLKNYNTLFIEALDNKNYSLANDLIKKGVPNLLYDKENELQTKQAYSYLIELKFHLRNLYLDGEFYLAKKIISNFIIKRNQNKGESILTREDLFNIGEYLISKKSDNIHYFWNEYFKNENNIKFLIRFTICAIQSKNTNFLSSYDNIKFNFNTSLLLKNAVNTSFSKTFNPDFFENLRKFYSVYNPKFNFTNNIVRALNHQLLIRDTETINTTQFKHIEQLYYTYFPNFYSFKVAYGLYRSINKKPENEEVLNSYIQEIFQLHDLNNIKEHGGFLFKKNPILHEKFKLFNKLSKNLLVVNEIKTKVNKI